MSICPSRLCHELFLVSVILLCMILVNKLQCVKRMSDLLIFASRGSVGFSVRSGGFTVCKSYVVYLCVNVLI